MQEEQTGAFPRASVTKVRGFQGKGGGFDQTIGQLDRDGERQELVRREELQFPGRGGTGWEL